MCEKKLCHLRGSCIILQAVWCNKQAISCDICKNGKRTKSITELQKEGSFQDWNLKKAIISMRVARFKNHLIEAKCNRIVFRTCSIETPGKVTVWKNVDDIAVSRNQRLTSTQRSSSDFHRATKRLMKLVAETCRNETSRRSSSMELLTNLLRNSTCKMHEKRAV